jgi:DNA-binding NtrC family response regulator
MDKIRVLMVDDSPDDRELFRRMLLRTVKAELAFHEAEDGAEANELLRTIPDLEVILLDQKLPGASGLILMHDWQENYPDLPAVVLITGHGGERVAVEAMKLGACDYISKHDCTPEELAHAVRHAAYSTRLRRELAARQSPNGDSQFQRGEMSGARRTVATFLHEINSPLTGIINYTLLLLDEAPSEEQRTIYHEILEACRQIDRVLHRMEDLDELRARPGASHSGPLDLRALQ